MRTSRLKWGVGDLLSDTSFLPRQRLGSHVLSYLGMSQCLTGISWIRDESPAFDPHLALGRYPINVCMEFYKDSRILALITEKPNQKSGSVYNSKGGGGSGSLGD